MVALTTDESLIAESIISMLFDAGLEEVFSCDKYLYEIVNMLDDEDGCFCSACGATRGCVRHDDLPGWIIKFDLCPERHYTRREARLYKEACQDDIEEFFCPVIPLGIFNGVEFYVAKACECGDYLIAETISDKCSDDEEEKEAIYYSICDGNNCFDYVFPNEGDLYNWLEDHKVNDLHCGNFGIYEGEIVIIDYAGYGSLVDDEVR